MNGTKIQPSTTLLIRRKLPAPRERVFDAWTQPEHLSQWLGPRDFTAPDVHIDLRPGGTYRFTLQRANGEQVVATGVFREVRKPEHLSYTWRWEETDPAMEHETLVTLDLYDRDGGTELVLKQERFVDEASRDGHTRGWNEALDKLEAFLRP